MPNRGKSRRSSKFKRQGKYTKQFARTVKKKGRWRGKVVDKERHDAYIASL